MVMEYEQLPLKVMFYKQQMASPIAMTFLFSALLFQANHSKTSISLLKVVLSEKKYILNRNLKNTLLTWR